MRLGRRASLLVAFYLLTSAATAYAECAWIVWQHVDMIYRQPGPASTSRWGIGEITDSRTECEKRNDASVNETKPNPAWIRTVDRRPGLSTVVRSVHKEHGTQIITGYQCLPDTVDPRGAKAGGPR